MIPKFRSWVENVRHPEFSFMQYAPEFNGEINQIFEKDGEIQHGVKVSYMQSTGLKDKNGVEIFEGDIVKTFSNINKFTDSFAENVEPNYGYTSIVRDGASFKMTYKGKPSYVLNENAGSMAEYMEVLGNIWENPELLEEQNNDQI